MDGFTFNRSACMDGNTFLIRRDEWFDELNNVPVNEWMCDGMRFENCTFSGCNFKEWTFRSCVFINCKFNKCNFSLASFDRCKWALDAPGPENFFCNTSFSSCFNDCRMLRTNFFNCTFTLVEFKGLNEWDYCFFVNSSLEHCFFPGQDLRDIRWSYCDFINMNFREAIYGPNIPLVCPETGSFIAYKKVIKGLYGDMGNCTDFNYIIRRWTHDHENAVIAKLEIPEDALRCSSTSRKCRASKAKVLEFQDLVGNHLDISICHSSHKPSFIYEVRNVVEVPDFDMNRWNECSKGIHFFMSRDEAVNYKF